MYLQWRSFLLAVSGIYSSGNPPGNTPKLPKCPPAPPFTSLLLFFCCPFFPLFPILLCYFFEMSSSLHSFLITFICSSSLPVSGLSGTSPQTHISWHKHSHLPLALSLSLTNTSTVLFFFCNCFAVNSHFPMGRRNKELGSLHDFPSWLHRNRKWVCLQVCCQWRNDESGCGSGTVQQLLLGKEWITGCNNFIHTYIKELLHDRFENT